MADIALEAQISPNDSALAGASKLFFYLWEDAWTYAQDTQDGDAKALHRMRVGLRRLRTAMQNFEGSKQQPLLSKGLREEIRGAQVEVRKLADTLGAVRDLDVLEDYVKHYVKKQLKTSIEASPGLEELVETLKEERKSRFKPLVKALRKAGKEGGLQEEFGRWALGLPAVKNNGAAFRDAAETMMSRHLDEVFAHQTSLHSTGSDEEHHELRKSLRRLRYTLETMSVAFEKPVKSYVKTLVDMQDTLGEMHDRAFLRDTTLEIFDDGLPEDVKAFNAHGVSKHGNLLAETQTAWEKAQESGFWDELRAL